MAECIVSVELLYQEAGEVAIAITDNLYCSIQIQKVEFFE
jgi:hypothetical protein